MHRLSILFGFESSSKLTLFFYFVCKECNAVLDDVKIRAMEEFGELDEKIKGLIETEPPSSAPFPPSTGKMISGTMGLSMSLLMLSENYGKQWLSMIGFIK